MLSDRGGQVFNQGTRSLEIECLLEVNLLLVDFVPHPDPLLFLAD